MDVTAGTRIADRYVIERPLAKGGMGAVFVARDERMGARVALKLTAAAGAAADGLALRFAREARIGHRLATRRQGFVRASDWGRIDAVQLYLVMDLVDDATPLDLHHGSREERIGRWRRAAELVQVAHEQGVIHRDLKPANFLQAPDGAIFLTDFGLAKVVDEGDDEGAGEHVSLTVTGVGFGTPPYMPPEQLEDAKHADQRADVFALGCMLFEAAVLRLPYPGPTPTSIMSAHMKVRAGTLPAPRPRDVDATVSAAVDVACAHALELDLDRRAPSVAALLATLDGAAPTRLEPAPGAAVETISGGRTTAPEPRPAPIGSDLPTGANVPTETPRPLAAAEPAPSPPARPESRRALAVAVTLLLVLAGAFAADVGGLRRRVAALVAAPPSSPSPTTVPEHPTPTRAALVGLTPTDGAVVPELVIDVTGRVEPPRATVRVQGMACPVGPDGAFSLARLSLKPGPNELVIEVRPDGSGEPLRRTVTLTADLDDPLLTLDSPAEDLETADDHVSLRGRVDDATAVRVSIDGEVVARLPAGGGALAARVGLPALGRRTLQVVVEDEAGRRTRLARSVVRRAPRLAVTLDAPADGAATSAPQVRVAGRVTGDVAPDALVVRARDVALPVDASGRFEGLLDLGEGQHTLEVVAVGGVAPSPAEARATARVLVDRTAPTLRVVSPPDGEATTEDAFTLEAEVTDAAAWVDVALAGAATRTVRVARGQRLRERLALGAGAQVLTLTPTDPTGNRGLAVRFTRTRVGPAWLSSVPADRRPAALPRGVSYGERQGEYVNEKDGSVLVWVPAGTFRMGEDLDWRPEGHEVRLTRGFFVGKHEVTWAQYRRFCQATGRAAPSNVIDHAGRFEAGEQHPVFNVSWHDAQAYLEWAGLRLPTEAEWEYAARGADGRAYPWGNDEPGAVRCNLGSERSIDDLREGADGYLYTSPVGAFARGASPFGALDMAGNVFEWVQDRHESYYPEVDQRTDPTGPVTGTKRVYRGGAWDLSADCCRTNYRYPTLPDKRFANLGFRPARSADDAAPEVAPSGLQHEDLVVGTGVSPKPGQTVFVHYTGWLADGRKVDSSVDRGQPFSFQLGQGHVIEGLDEGVATMKVGGKRRLTIPPALAYGDRGLPGAIPPDSTLIFEVELLRLDR